jgi:hypothetical protein
MVTLWEMSFFSFRTKSWNSAGVRTFRASVTENVRVEHVIYLR